MYEWKEESIGGFLLMVHDCIVVRKYIGRMNQYTPLTSIILVKIVDPEDHPPSLYKALFFIQDS